MLKINTARTPQASAGTRDQRELSYRVGWAATMQSAAWAIADSTWILSCGSVSDEPSSKLSVSSV
jgi:hypothetical protein